MKLLPLAILLLISATSFTSNIYVPAANCMLTTSSIIDLRENKMTQSRDFSLLIDFTSPGLNDEFSAMIVFSDNFEGAVSNVERKKITGVGAGTSGCVVKTENTDGSMTYVFRSDLVIYSLSKQWYELTTVHLAKDGASGSATTKRVDSDGNTSNELNYNCVL